MMVGDKEGQLSYTPLEAPYVLRFYPFSQDDKYQVYEMSTVIDEFLADNFETWIITEETRPKLHYHIYLESPLLLDPLKKKVREFIYPYYPDRKRGFGTKQYSCLVSDNPLNAIMYTLKQRGEYHFSGFDQEFVDKCIASSFELPDNLFDEELAEFVEQFMTNGDPYKLAENMCILLSKYNKRIHFKDIQGFVNSKIIKRDNTQASFMCRKLLSF